MKFIFWVFVYYWIIRSKEGGQVEKNNRVKQKCIRFSLKILVGKLKVKRASLLFKAK